MSSHDHPIWKLADQIQMDLRQLTARMVELRSQLAQLKLTVPEPVVCECGSRFRSQLELQEHAYHHHHGPLPEAWARADTLAGDPE